MSNKNFALTFMKVEEGFEVDWAQIMFNNLCRDWIDGPRCKKKCKWMGNKRIKKKTCHSALVLERLFNYMFQKDFRVIENKTKITQKKTKITKEEMQQVLDSRKRTSRGSPWTMEKRKNKAEIGEGSKQRWKSGEDVRPQKYMRRNNKQLGITVSKVVTCHIPFKPQKDNNSVQEQGVVETDEARTKSITTINNNNIQTTLIDTT